MTTEPEKLRELLKDFDAAMHVTRTADGQLRSRPMAVADVGTDGTMWFFTQRHSPKVAEIEHDHHVNVAMQSKLKFVSITGTATAVDDHRKIDELWNDSWETWFPDGKDDPSLLLLRLHAEGGEYWDNSGTSGIKYLIEAGRAYLTGTLPAVEDDPKIHGKVKL